MDAKSIANRFSMPLVTMNGRDNCGHCLLFAAAFIDREDENAFKYFYKSAVGFLGPAPKMVSTDQCPALINAVAQTTPHTKVVLDDYHLNKNQRENVNTHVLSISSPHRFNEMNGEIYRLRRSKDLVQYWERFKEVWNKWFPHATEVSELPRWFSVSARG